MQTKFDSSDFQDQPEIIYAIALAEALGYTIYSHGVGSFMEGWAAVLPGETEPKEDGDDQNYVGWFSNAEDMAEELTDELEQKIILESGIDEFLWDMKTPEEKIVYANSLNFLKAQKEARELRHGLTGGLDVSDELIALVENETYRMMFHGTSNPRDFFQDTWEPRGDSNSALGTHFAETPFAALEYAQTSFERNEGPEAVVLVAFVPAENPHNIFDYYEFFGFDDNGDPKKDHGEFREMRNNLLAKGHDIVDFEDGEQVISVCLNPERATIVAKLTPAMAERLDGLMQKQDDLYSGKMRIEMLRKVLDNGFSTSLKRKRTAP